MRHDEDEELLSTSEAAALAGVCARAIQTAVQRGELVPVLGGSGRRSHRFRESDILAWIPPCERSRQRYSDAELLDLLRRAERAIGHVPAQKDILLFGFDFPSASTYLRRFGGWRRAIDLARRLGEGRRG